VAWVQRDLGVGDTTSTGRAGWATMD